MMNRFIISLVLLVVVSSLIETVRSDSVDRNPGNCGRGRRPWGGSGLRNFTISRICSNTTVAQELVDRIRQLINDLKTNETFAPVLEQYSALISYLENADNSIILMSNCQEYFNGLKNSLKGINQFQAINRDVRRQIRRIIVSLIFRREKN